MRLLFGATDAATLSLRSIFQKSLDLTGLLALKFSGLTARDLAGLKALDLTGLMALDLTGLMLLSTNFTFNTFLLM